MQTSRLVTLVTMIKSGLVPVFYIEELSEAVAFVKACAAGGVRVIEFTNRGRQALPVFQQLRSHFPDLMLGIGSIVDAPTAAVYIAHGADFVVSPAFDADVARVCNQHKVAYIPGCVTATEIQKAHALGCEIVKLFPANQYGTGTVRAIKAPMPWTRIMPTGGIDTDEDTIKQWFEAGVSCIGIGSSLQKSGDISMTCSNILEWIAMYRKDDAHAL